MAKKQKKSGVPYPVGADRVRWNVYVKGSEEDKCSFHNAYSTRGEAEEIARGLLHDGSITDVWVFERVTVAGFNMRLSTKEVKIPVIMD